MLFFTLLKESLYFAIHALRVNRLRTTLSLLGITIGIFAIIAVFTAVDSIANKIRTSVQSLGNDVVYVQTFPWVPTGEFKWWEYFQRPDFTVKNQEELQRRLTLAKAVVYFVSTTETVRYETSYAENTTIVAASHDYNQVKSFDISEGRYFTEHESANGNALAIIGSTIATALFPNEDPIGKEIKLFGRKVTVLGLFKSEGESMMGNSSDNQVLVPLEFARTVMNVENDESDHFIMVAPKEGVNVEAIKGELEGALRSLRSIQPTEEDNFALNEVSVLAEPLNQMFGVVGTAGWIIGAFSILVGGFGIANIMFVSVRERTSQIGIQKSLGAKSWFILMQFLAESVILCFLGGVIGLILDYVLVLIANKTLDYGFILSFSNISLGITISILIGIISGFIPAYSAAQLDPVEAIRSNS